MNKPGYIFYVEVARQKLQAHLVKENIELVKVYAEHCPSLKVNAERMLQLHMEAGKDDWFEDSSSKEAWAISCTKRWVALLYHIRQGLCKGTMWVVNLCED
eukprot:1835987-Amphidinium_carterae.1